MRHLLFLHLLGASVWVGGHLVLLFSVLPGALRRRDVQPVRAFEQLYERVGIPALLLQIATGIWLAGQWLPHAQWRNCDASYRARAVSAERLALEWGK